MRLTRVKPRRSGEQDPVVSLIPFNLKTRDTLMTKLFDNLKRHSLAYIGLAIILSLFSLLGYTPAGEEKSWVFYFFEGAAIPADIFAALIRFLVPMLVLCSIFTAGSGPSDKKEDAQGLAGQKMGFVSLWFILTTTVSCLFMVAVMQFANPAQWVDTSFMDEKVAQIQAEREAQKPFSEMYLEQREREALKNGDYAIASHAEKPTISQAREGIKATLDMNLFRDLTFANMLQIVIGTLVLGLSAGAARRSGGNSSRVVTTVIQMSEAGIEIALFAIQKALLFVPFVVFGLMGRALVESGSDLLVSLSAYMVVFVTILLVYVFLFYGGVACIIREKFSTFLIRRKALIAAAFASSSSSAVMGQSIQTIKEDGVDDETAHTVIPMGATINMDGSGMYQIFAAMFVMTLSDVPTDFVSMLPLVLAIVLASIGTPGAPGVSLFILIPILTPLGVESGLILLLLAVDRPLDMSRTVVNVLGDQLAAKLSFWHFHGKDSAKHKQRD
jgi:proton glutamate symport protein